MGEPNYIDVNIQTEGVVATAVRAVGKLSIVGFSTVVTTGTPREHSSVSDINTTYGATSAVARSAREAITNGANPVIIVPVDATNVQYMDGGSPGPDSFSTDATEVSLTDFPALGTLTAVEGTISAPTKTLVEGPDPAVHDYIVDVGNKKVIFHAGKEPSASGEIEYKVILEADLATGLVNLESEDVNFVTIAYALGNTDLLSGSSSSLETHIVSTSTGSKPRMGIAANAKDITTLTLANGLVNDRIAIFHHKSYYDVAAIVGGAMSTYKPQESMALKPVTGDLSTGNFSDANYITYRANQVNSLMKHSKIPTPAYRIAESFTLSTDAFKKYIDTVRVIDDSSFKIEAALTNPALLGSVRLATVPGMNRLRTILNRVMASMVKDGEIDSYAYEIPGEEIVRKSLGDRTPEEKATLDAMVASRNFQVVVSVKYSGSVHTLDVDITYSGT